jgi:signal recognition particle GTPase
MFNSDTKDILDNLAKPQWVVTIPTDVEDLREGSWKQYYKLVAEGKIKPHGTETREQAIAISNEILSDAERERLEVAEREAERDRIEMELFEQMTPLRKRANKYIDGDPDDPR